MTLSNAEVKAKFKELFNEDVCETCPASLARARTVIKNYYKMKSSKNGKYSLKKGNLIAISSLPLKKNIKWKQPEYKKPRAKKTKESEE